MLSRRATVRSHVVTAEPEPQPFLGFSPLPREVPRGNARNPRKESFPYFLRRVDALPLLPAPRRRSSPTSCTAPTLFPYFQPPRRNSSPGFCSFPEKFPAETHTTRGKSPSSTSCTASTLFPHFQPPPADCTPTSQPTAPPQEVSEPNCFQYTESVIYRAFRSVRGLRLTVSSVAERKACGNHSLDPPQSEVGGDRGHGREGSRRDPVG